MSTVRVVVSSRLPGGHRRCGLFWPSEQTEAEVDEKLLAELHADAHLVVIDVPSPPVQLTTPAPVVAEKPKGSSHP